MTEQTIDELIANDFPVFASAEFLKDHAEAIRDLVGAAEKRREAKLAELIANIPSQQEYANRLIAEADESMFEALAKLEEA